MIESLTKIKKVDHFSGISIYADQSHAYLIWDFYFVAFFKCKYFLKPKITTFRITEAHLKKAKDILSLKTKVG